MDKCLLEMFNVTLVNPSRFEGGESKKDIEKTVFNNPIEELLISETSIDLHMNKNKAELDKPLLLEIKSIRNVSKPFQRVSKDQDWDEAEIAEKKAQKVGPQKGAMYQLVAHDGCRFVKLNLMFAN